MVGAGQAGVQLADSLRMAGFAGTVTLLEEEQCLPYARPPLSKDHLAPGADPAAVPLRGAAFYANKGIDLRTGTAVTGVDREHHVVRLADGGTLPYTALVFATGASNRTLSVPGMELSGIHALRTLTDATRLRAELDRASSVVVVGAGFIGLEFAAAARARGCPVTVLEAAPRPLARAVTPAVSAHLVTAHTAMGTHLRLGESVAAFLGASGRVETAVTTTGERLPADLVLVGIGAAPRDDLARAAGLAVDAGIVVDAVLRTSDPDVYAIGDCARFPSVHLAGSVRLESVQNAADQAKHLAQTMLGHPSQGYAAVPWFWSTQGGLRLQIAGLIAEGDSQVIPAGMPADRLSVLSYRHGRLVAVETVNAPAEHLAARRLLADGRSPDPVQAAGPAFSLRDFAAATAGASPAVVPAPSGP